MARRAWGIAGLLWVAVAHSGQGGDARPDAAAAAPSWPQALTEAAVANRLRLGYQDGRFAGPAWDRLVAEGRSAHFFLLGEEHGIAEAPRLAAQLFEALANDGYARFVIETSPSRAALLDAAARSGLPALRAQLKVPGEGAAFFTMEEEAAMLARVRAAVPGDAPVLWGVDYEVFADRMLIRRLEALSKPTSAVTALARLREASTAAWGRYATRKNPGLIFSFSGDPRLVAAVRSAWPDAPPEADRILRTLQATLEINALWVNGEHYASNAARATHLRENLRAHWTAERAAGGFPRVFAKMGASHLMGGRSTTETCDLGALIPEIAFMEGVSAVRVAILPGLGSEVAVFDPVAWTYRPASAKDGYAKGLAPLSAAAFEDGFTLVDLRTLRALVGARTDVDPALARMVHGYDLLLLMTGSTPSRNLELSPARAEAVSGEDGFEDAGSTSQCSCPRPERCIVGGRWEGSRSAVATRHRASTPRQRCDRRVARSGSRARPAASSPTARLSSGDARA